MGKRVWQWVGIGLIAIGFGLFVWVEVWPPLTVPGFMTWGIVSLAFGLAMFAWFGAGVTFLFKRYFSHGRATDGPEADFDDQPRP